MMQNSISAYFDQCMKKIIKVDFESISPPPTPPAYLFILILFLLSYFFFIFYSKSCSIFASGKSSCICRVAYANIVHE